MLVAFTDLPIDRSRSVVRFFSKMSGKTPPAFDGSVGQILAIPSRTGTEAEVSAGVGERKAVSALGMEAAAAAAVRAVMSRCSDTLQIDLSQAWCAAHWRSVVAGALLAAYRYQEHVAKPRPNQSRLAGLRIHVGAPADKASAWEHDGAAIRGALWARDLVNRPPNLLHPAAFAAEARALEPLGLEVDILEPDELRREGLGALLAVGQAAKNGPRLVCLRWLGSDTGPPDTLLVGKGITFDSGGLSIKTMPHMAEMKADMAGAAAVLAVMRVLAEQKSAARVAAVLPLAENGVGPDAYRPSDIVRTHAGLNVEIVNTDAEGRLILADALSYGIARFNPSRIIDIATLTWTPHVLGQEHGALFTADNAMASDLEQAGLETDEPVWRLPMPEAYAKLVESPIADLRNLTGGNHAQSALAATFLKRFVGATPWAHLDVTGMSWGRDTPENPKLPSWASGYGVRLLHAYLTRADRKAA